MEAIGAKEMSPLPKNIKIVNKVKIVCTTGGGEPGVQAQQPTKIANASATGGGGARNENMQPGLRKLIKRLSKIQF